MEKTYECLKCGYEIKHISDVKQPPPKKCTLCKGTEFKEKGG